MSFLSFMQLRRLLPVLMAWGLWSGLLGAAWAAPAPVGAITNTATGSFVDSVSGFSVSVNSNTVTVNVLPYEMCTLSAGQSVVRAPGSTLTLPHVLTNNGNTNETCLLQATTAAGSNYTPQNVQVVQDLNGNGVVDPGEPVIAPGSGITLAPGASVNLLLVLTIPSTANPGASATLDLAATSAVQNAGNTSSDVVGVNSGAALNVTKSASSANPTPGSLLSYTLSASNVGNIAAAGVAVTVDGAAQTLVILRDAIPANTTFNSLSPSGAALRLYHRLGDAPNIYLSTPPSAVDGIAWGLPSLAAGSTLMGSFSVQVNANAAGTLNNTGYADYVSGGAMLTAPSNAVQLALPSNPATMAFYGNNSYGSPISQSSMGAPLYLQVNAAACNTDPTQVLSLQLQLSSQLSHDQETYTAIETAANTGIFRVQPNLPTADARTHPVVTGDGTLELLPNDTVTATVLNCSAASHLSASLLIDPLGVVYDSRSNTPVAGATVTLLNSGGQPATVYQADGVTPAPSTVVTGIDGAFTFPQVAAGTYSLRILPPMGYVFPSAIPPAMQPAGRTVVAPGSYGGAFQVTGPGPVRIDVPLDPGAHSGLVVKKTVSQPNAEIGDMLDYTITVSNQTGLALASVSLADWLPPGFKYLRGTSKLQGVAVADPLVASGSMGWPLGAMANNAQLVLTYRAAITPSAAAGNAINTAQAQSGALRSNLASVAVQILGGVFNPQAVLIGKVYADCNRNRQQDAGEPGIPGVRVWLADGTYAITDGAGKYSIYGITPRTTVAAIDPTTLPEGAQLEVLNHRQAQDPSSQFVDLQKGELHRADFAVAGCSAELNKQIEARRKALDQPDEIAQLSQNLPNVTQTLAAPSSTDPRTLPAVGTMGQNGAQAAGAIPTIANPLDLGTFGGSSLSTLPLGAVGDLGGAVTQQSPAARPVFPALAAPASAGSVASAATAATAAPSAAEAATLEHLLPQLDAQVAFMDLKDAQVLPSDQTRVRVKGPAGATLQLTVNGQAVPLSQVGVRASLASKGVSAWEYIGVQLKAGVNTLSVTAQDPFGNARGSATLTLQAPGALAALRIVLPNKAVADTQTPVWVKVQAVDAKGLPVTSRLPLTLSSSTGLWQIKNLNPAEPGTHVFIEGGEGSYPLLPPAHPETAVISVSSGKVEASAKLSFAPNLRPLFGVGLVEGVLNLSHLSAGSMQPTSATDAFEQAIGSVSEKFDNGQASVAARTQLFLKGKVLGSTLLTLAYDSDKPANTQLFRNIQPDQFYPVYGDSSVKGFDAQSTGKLYVRLDRGNSYVLLGDYSTQSDNPARQLTQYTRALNGVKGHGESGKWVVDGFASHTASSQVVTEIQGNGTSGPYQLNPQGMQGSQQVDLITRDRNQLGVVLSDKPMAPFVDYTIDTLSGQLLFTAPVPAVDPNLNPIFIRINYSVDQGGPKHWVGGASAQYQATDALNVGVSAVQDKDPVDGLKLVGVNATLKVGSQSTVVAEVAHSDSESKGSGGAQRLEWRGQTQNLQGRVWATHTDANFYNPSALQSGGQSQYGEQINLRLDASSQIVVEALRTESPQAGWAQTAASASLQYSLPSNMKLSVGVRHASGQAQTTVPNDNPAIPGGTAVDFTSLYARLDAPVPHLPGAAGFVQYERALGESAQIATVGGTYEVGPWGKFYFTHQTGNSLSGAYGLNPNTNQYSTVLGFQSAVVDQTQYFNEYRIGQSVDGQAAETAIGVRHLWQITPGLGVSASVARIHPIYGQFSDESTSVATAVSYTASETSKASARVEWRDSQQSQSWLLTGALANRVNRDWTLLNRLMYSKLNNYGAGQQLLGQIQSGFALRPEDSNVWNGLAMLGYKRYMDTTLPLGQQINERAWIGLGQLNIQPTPELTIATRLGLKYAINAANGVRSSGWNWLLGGRVTRDLGNKWDMGVQAFANCGFGTCSHALGAELGYLVQRNLWVSGGYNLVGFNAPDLAGGAYTQRGAYLRLRFKFGADAFEDLGTLRAPPNKDNNAAAAFAPNAPAASSMGGAHAP